MTFSAYRWLRARRTCFKYIIQAVYVLTVFNYESGLWDLDQIGVSCRVLHCLINERAELVMTLTTQHISNSQSTASRDNFHSSSSHVGQLDAFNQLPHHAGLTNQKFEYVEKLLPEPCNPHFAIDRLKMS